MKKLLIGTAFVAMLATPALAQSYNPDYGTGNANPAVNSLYGGQSYDSEGLTEQHNLSRGRASDAYAYEPGPGSHRYHRYIQREDSDFPVYGEQ